MLRLSLVRKNSVSCNPRNIRTDRGQNRLTDRHIVIELSAVVHTAREADQH
jgi:hypothetical protein